MALPDLTVGWTPPERPAWVVAANAGEVTPIAIEAERPLALDALVGEVGARVGLRLDDARAIDAAFGHLDFPAEPALDRLGRFLEALENEAELHLLGRFMARRLVRRLLEVRRQLIAWLRADPGVQEERIEAPLIVAGAPRTGTTILHRLLAADPAHRVPEGWELLRPVPPPSPDPEHFARDPRIALAEEELVGPQTVVSGIRAIHAYGARQPKECLSAWTLAFQSEELTTRFAVPEFEAWLLAQPLEDAYRMHRLVLQVLQRGWGRVRWVLKSPVHLHALPTLFETYPDARVAIPHRDPRSMLASLTSLVANLRWAHSDRVDPKAIGRAHVARYATTLDRLVDWTEAKAFPERSIHHGQYREFVDAPLETVRALYARFELAWTRDVERALGTALEASPADQHGAHHYDDDDLGADAATLRARFARYRAAFSVPERTED